MTRNLVAEARRCAADGLTLSQASERTGLSVKVLTHLAKSNCLVFATAPRQVHKQPSTQAEWRAHYTGLMRGLSRWPGGGGRAE